MTYLIGEAFVDALKKRKVKYLDISSIEATKDEFENAMKQGAAKELFFFGHGSPFRLLSDQRCRQTYIHKSILDIFDVKDAGFDFVFACACHSGRGLGYYSTEYNKYLRTYMGFIGPIMFTEESVEALQRALTIGIVSMVADKTTARIAYQKTLDELSELRERYRRKVAKARKAGDDTSRLYAIETSIRDFHRFLYLGGDDTYRIRK